MLATRASARPAYAGSRLPAAEKTCGAMPDSPAPSSPKPSTPATRWFTRSATPRPAPATSALPRTSRTGPYRAASRSPTSRPSVIMMAKAAYAAAANPAELSRLSRRYTALQSAAAPSPTSRCSAPRGRCRPRSNRLTHPRLIAVWGPLALVGSGEYLPVMLDVERQLIDGRPPRYVQLPTAAGREGRQRLDYWVRLGQAQAERLGVESVPLVVIDRTQAEDPAIVSQ